MPARAGAGARWRPRRDRRRRTHPRAGRPSPDRKRRAALRGRPRPPGAGGALSGAGLPVARHRGERRRSVLANRPRPSLSMAAGVVSWKKDRLFPWEVLMKSIAYSVAPAVVALACVLAAPAFAAQASFYQLPSGAFPHDVAPAPDGTVWYSGQQKDSLGRFDPKTGKNEGFLLGPGAAADGV